MGGSQVAKYVEGRKTAVLNGVKRLFRGADLSGGRELVAVPCREVDVSATPAEVVIVPWGDVVRTDGGRFVLDEGSAAKCVKAFKARGTDMVIDYDHQTLGGEYAAPDGKSPAAGWIKWLTAVPDRGLVASVEWTARAQETIANKEYKYLSPVVLVNPDTRHAERVHNVGLTNMPAITNMPALVNSDGSEPGGSDSNTEVAMDYKAALIRVLGLSETATDADIEAAIGGNAEPTVNAVRLALDKTQTLLVDSEQRVRDLQAKLDNAELDMLLFKNSDKIPPSAEEAFREMYAADKGVAVKWLEKMQPLVTTVKTRRAVSNATGVDRDRISIINSARSEFRSKQASGERIICSEQAYVNMMLRDASLPTLNDADVRTFQISIN